MEGDAQPAQADAYLSTHLNYDEHCVYYAGVLNIMLDVKTEYFVGIQIK